MEKSKKIDTLKANHMFVKAYKKGVCSVSGTMSVYVMRNYDRNKTLLGITVSKSMGIAVRRNKIKRKLREAYRTFHPFIKKGYIIVIVSRKACFGAEQEKICSDMRSLLRKSGLLTS